MVLNLIFIILATITLTSCITPPNANPNILSQAPYNKVRYIYNINNKYEVVDNIQVTTRGDRANILNTLPELYKQALEHKEAHGNKIYIGNISLTSFIKRENYQVSYQDCKQVPESGNFPHNECRSVPESRSVPHQQCSGYGSNQRCYTSYRSETHYVNKCQTVYKYETRYVNKCETKYRTEVRNVLYQKAVADIFTKKQ